jgi:hypothetical protein
MGWVAGQDLAPGASRSLALPMSLAGHSADGRVQAARTADGRRCVLVKTRTGYKGNFEGLMYCDAPLRPGEIVQPGGAPAYVSLPELGVFEELYIRKQVDAQLYEVYFDLN